ncbi:MAG TPA: helix-turn-helix transcriptional regulator [Terriglobales bacterium]|nr:helix-turn-helix transcriptional regulator [Terriglobales bacterium]
MDQAPLPNRRLRLQRRLRGWSQDDVATGLCGVASGRGEAELGVDATMVSRWERGTRFPRPRYVRLLCQLFGLSVEQLGLVRDDSCERIELVLDLRCHVDAETVEHLERVTMALERLEPTAISSRALLGPATGHLDAVSELLRTSASGDIRRRLCSVAGEAAGLVGWLRWNLDDAAGASACFRTGLRAAHEADDGELGAYLVGAVACRLPRQQDPADSLRLLTGRTMGYAQADASPATRAWLAAKEADAWARLGREAECLRALERAGDLVEGLEEDEPGRPRFTVVDRGWLAGERGASLARLGRLDEARSTLRPVLARADPATERDRLWLLAALAGAHVDAGEPEEACRLAQAALTGAARRHLAPVVHLVREITDRLEQHRRCHAVQELEARLSL